MRARLALLLVLSLALAACASVLGFKPRSPAHPFEHHAHAVAGVQCVQCHEGVQTAGKNGPPHYPSDASCRRCHDKPHDDRPCSLCHGESRVRSGVELARSRLRFDHRTHMSEVHGECVRCHVEVTEPSDAILPTMASCFACHRHKDQWTLRDCNGCHVDLAAEDSPPESHLVHDGDWLREHGVRAASARDLCSSCHSERSCAKCHGVGTVPALPSRLAFDDVSSPSMHRAGFRSRHADEARANPGLCSTCHSESSCQACHAASGVLPGSGARSPHPPGWLTPGFGGGEHGMAARVDPEACAGCHGGAGEQLCVSCHRVGGPGGNPHGPGFSSTKNARRDLPCRLCHGVGP